MTFDEIIEELERTKDYPASDPASDDVLDCAINIIRHYRMQLDSQQEPQKGLWIVHPKGIYAHLVCNKCLSRAPYDCKTNFCPSCGADMREVEDAENDPSD